MSSYWYHEYYPKSRPREAKGGIKAQSKRGAFGTSWWAKRWIAVLESFNIGSRLDRGRSYARRGQVLSIDIEEGRVEAEVQGSRPSPYDVVIEVKTLTAANWKKLANVLSEQALFAAKLLAGEMPQDIEESFESAGLSLFPEKLKDLATHCSCPDYSNPCKHIAAVYYLLGEEFDRDPFLLFKLRGMSREDLIAQLEAAGGSSGATGAQPSPAASPECAAAPQPAEPLMADPSVFWNGAPLPDDIFGEVRAPVLAAALPRRLGNFPFWRSAQPLLETVEPIYRTASAAGMDVFLGQRVKAQ